MKSFFVENKNFDVDDKIVLEGNEHHHLSKVLRSKIGEVVEIYPNDDRVVRCEILEILNKKSILRVKDVCQANTNPISNLDVFIALLKADKFEFLITKLTELGVKRIIPFESEFCIGKNVGDKKERYIQIAKDACKQCKRTKIIEIDLCKSFNDMLDLISQYDMVIFAFENEKMSSLNQVLSKIKVGNKVAIIIGSEGGFSNNEANQIINKGARVVSLGSRILRAETASLMLASLVLHKLGEYDLKSS